MTLWKKGTKQYTKPEFQLTLSKNHITTSYQLLAGAFWPNLLEMLLSFPETKVPSIYSKYASSAS